MAVLLSIALLLSDGAGVEASGRAEGVGSVPMSHPVTKTALRSSSVRGAATWYCCTRSHSASEMVGAAGPALRRMLGSRWRGATVRVCRLQRCVLVRLVDWCGCPNGRIIDLHPGAFRRLAPLSVGVIRVGLTR